MVEATKNTYTLRPGESSVYSLSMVFDEPPAPAARVEFGFETVLPVARRLSRRLVQFSSSPHTAVRRLTGRLHQLVWRQNGQRGKGSGSLSRTDRGGLETMSLTNNNERGLPW